MSLATNNNSFRDIAFIALFSFAAMAPAYFYGIPGGNDQWQHLQFAWTVHDSVSNGDLYPSFAASTNHGFGDYGLRFYPPLTYYLLAGVYAVLGDWFFAVLIGFTLAFFAGGVGVYLWTKDEFGQRQALIAAAIYTFAPYHLNQFYNNALFAEFFAMAVLPFCFLFLTRVCRRGSLVDICGLATAYALLILTHLPLTILGSLAMAIFGLVLLQRSSLFPTVAKSLAAIVSAVVMTAFYWSRWLPEMAWLKHASPAYFSTTWDYRSNFLLLPDHFLKFGEDALNLWFADLMLVVTLLIAIPAIVYLVANRAAISRPVIALAAVFGIAVFLTTPLSSFVWANAAFLQKVQFPWRWLAIVSLAGSVLASLGIVRAADVMKSGGSLLVTVGLGLVLAIYAFSAVFIPKGSLYTPRTELNTKMATAADSEGCECWWPIWAERDAFGPTEKVIAGTNGVEITHWEATKRQFRIDASSPATVTVAAFYYPRWHAAVNGVEVPVGKTKEGAISLEVPAGLSDVELSFREPSYVTATTVASLLVWPLVLALIAFLLVKSRRVAANAA